MTTLTGAFASQQSLHGAGGLPTDPLALPSALRGGASAPGAQTLHETSLGEPPAGSITGGGQRIAGFALPVSPLSNEGLRVAIDWIQANAANPANREVIKATLQNLTRLAGGATALASRLRPLGAGALNALKGIAAAVSLPTLATAFATTAAVLGVFQEPLSSYTPSQGGRPAPVQGRRPGPVEPTRDHSPDAPDSAPTTNTPTSAPPDLSTLPIGKAQIALSQQGESNAQAAHELMTQASTQVAPLNSALRQFYFDASGGAAARANGSLRNSIATVQTAKDQLSRIVADSNGPVANLRSAARSLQKIYGNPANAGHLYSDLSTAIGNLNRDHASLTGDRNNYKALVNALETWLSAAYKHAADGSKPLPAPPGVILAPTGAKASTVADGISQAARDAQQSVARSNANRSPAKLPVASAASRPSTSAQPVAAASQNVGWLDPATGAFSARPSSAQAMPVKVHWVDELPGRGQRVAMDVDGEAVEVEAEARKRSNTYELHLYFVRLHFGSGGPNGGGPDWKSKVAAAAMSALFVATTGQGTYSAHVSMEQSRTLRTDFSGAESNADAVLKSLNADSTDDQIRAARKSIWSGYLDAATKTLEEADWLKVLNLVGAGKIYAPQEIADLRGHWQHWLATDKPTAMPTGPDSTRAGYRYARVLAGDDNRNRHIEERFGEASTLAQAKIDELVAGTRGLGEAAGFDVRGYVAKHDAALRSTDPKTLDTARREAYVAIYRHYLRQVPDALGAGRVSAPERALFTRQLESWLAQQSKGALDTDRFQPSLSTRGDASAQLVITKAQAYDAIDKFENLVPRSSLGDRVSTEPGPAAATTAPRSTPVPQASPTTLSQPVPAASPPGADRTAALTAVKQAIAEHVDQGKLFNPPRTDNFGAIRFTHLMFFAPGESGLQTEIDAAWARATELYQAIKNLGNSAPEPLRSQDFRPLLTAFNDQVFRVLGQLQEALGQAQTAPQPATPLPAAQ
jgi:hypothetical protein